MKKITPITLLLFAVVPLFSQLSFQSQAFSQAKKEAINSSKPFLAYFGGKWCVTCQIMEETTFKSEGVKAAVENKYDLYKIDFDDSISEEWKEEFEICCLPSFLIFDDKAQLISKIEQPLTSTNLINLLSNPTGFDPENEERYYQKENDNSRPFASFSSFKTEIKPEQEYIEEEKEELETLRIIIRKPGTDFEQVKANLEKRSIIDKPKTESISKNNNLIAAETESKYESDESDYFIQLGYYANLDNAMKKSEKIKAVYNQPISITEKLVDKNVFYYVVMSNFDSYEETKRTYKKLKRNGQKAILKKK